MRLVWLNFWLCIALAGAVVPGVARAQNPDTIAPEQSAARAKNILNQLIQALGGQTYLGMRERQCDGRRALIGHDGALAGYVQIRESWNYPDKNRTDYFAKGRNTLLGYIIGVQDLDITHGGLIITTYSGDKGWTMDKGGVSDMPEDMVTEFQSAVQRLPENLLRVKNSEMNYRWGGLDTVDLHEVDWVELSDQEERVYRLAVDRMTHLLVRSVVRVRDLEKGQIQEDVSIFTNYLPKGGVQLPMQITRERDGRRIAQVFYETCEINPPLAADYFSREALVQRFKETGGKKGK